MYYLPIDNPEAWRSFLADPDKHWRDGYSAKRLAYAWQSAHGFPPKAKLMFESSGLHDFDNIEFLMGFPEHKVNLPGGNRASQNDLFVLASARIGLVAIMVEGKVEEPFGPLVSEWFDDPSFGKRERLSFLVDLLVLNEDRVRGARYQLLHRTASAILEARRFKCNCAVVLIHSFSNTNSSFDDYCRFLSALDLEGKLNRVVGPCTKVEPELYFGWVAES
jgi:hypothetical protein